MHGSFEVATLAGIEIGLQYTWLIAIFLIARSLAVGYFMKTDERQPLIHVTHTSAASATR